MINQAVPPGGGSGIALSRVEACDLPKRGRLGCTIFGSGGLRSRIPLTLILKLTCKLDMGSYLISRIDVSLYAHEKCTISTNTGNDLQKLCSNHRMISSIHTLVIGSISLPCKVECSLASAFTNLGWP